MATKFTSGSKSAGLEYRAYAVDIGIGGQFVRERGVKVLANLRKPLIDDQACDLLSGAQQYAKR